MNLLRTLALTAVVLAATAVCVRADTVIDFDGIAAPDVFIEVTPGTGQGPTLVFGDVSIDGGVVMNQSGWSDLATSSPNLYGTSDFAQLADGSLLPGQITAVLDVAGTYDAIVLDVINGYAAADFTLTAYDSASGLIGQTTIGLPSFPSAGGTLALVGIADLKRFTVTTSQAQGDIDFAIDTIRLRAAAPVPEPNALALLGAALAGVVPAARRWRRR